MKHIGFVLCIALCLTGCEIIQSVITGDQKPPTPVPTPTPQPKPPTPTPNPNELSAPEFVGMKLIAVSDVTIPLGAGQYGRTFAGGGSLVDFYVLPGYVSKHGNTFRKGTVITVEKAIKLRHTDGYGNSGTKLILDFAKADGGGITAYCYGLDSAKKSFWAIDKTQMQSALAGNFQILRGGPGIIE